MPSLCNAVEPPALLLLVVGGLEHNALKVAAGIGLGQVHRHSFAFADTGNVLLALLFAAKLVEGVNTRLQRPDVLEACIGSRDNLAEHGEHSVGQVKAAVAARHRHAPETSLAGGIEVLVGLGGIDHASVLEVRALEVNALRVRRNDVCSHVARDVEYLLVVLDGITKVNRCIVILFRISETLFFQLYNASHQGMVEIEPYLGVVTIIVCHCFLNFFSVSYSFVHIGNEDDNHNSMEYQAPPTNVIKCEIYNTCYHNSIKQQ